MKILITGGTGLIGSHLAQQAHARKHDVIVAGMINTPMEAQRLQELEQLGIQVRTGRLQNPEYARTLVEGCDAVIHLAAAQHETGVADSYFRDTNVEGTRVLLQASANAGVKRFVYGSTIGVYGSVPYGTVIDENTHPNPENIYGRTKLEAEGVVRSFSDRLETTIVRISETYGPGDLRLLKLFKAANRGMGVTIGSGRNQHHLIHVSDLVRGLLLAAERADAANQTFLLAGPAAVSTTEMINEISFALGRGPSRLHVPLWPFMFMASAMEAVAKPLGVRPPLHRRRLDFFRKSFCFSTRKAQLLLGFEPTISFASGARDTAQWYRSKGYLECSGSKGDDAREARSSVQVRNS